MFHSHTHTCCIKFCLEAHNQKYKSYSILLFLQVFVSLIWKSFFLRDLTKSVFSLITPSFKDSHLNHKPDTHSLVTATGRYCWWQPTLSTNCIKYSFQTTEHRSISRRIHRNVKRLMMETGLPSNGMFYLSVIFPDALFYYYKFAEILNYIDLQKKSCENF